MSKILIMNGYSYGHAIRGLGELTYGIGDLLKNPKTYSMVMFTGGADVSPSYYKHLSPKRMCQNNPERDAQEKRVFDTCLENGILMTGICRGFQFLNVMAGGILMHHIDCHEGVQHEMSTMTGEKLIVNSLHHQMVVPSAYSQLVGWSSTPRSDRYFGNLDAFIEYRGYEVEAAIFPEIKAFGVQYHPEMMPAESDGYGYYYSMVKNALNLPWRKFINAYTNGEPDVELFESIKHHSNNAG